MAIFAKNKTEKEVKDAKSSKNSKKVTTKTSTTKNSVISPAVIATPIATPTIANVNQPVISLIPHITEKANFHAEKLNSYTFKVINNGSGVNNVNKKSIAKAVRTMYKVTPTKVRIVNTAERNVSYRGRPVSKSGFKKAYVTLKKGDKIEIA
jgi:large subunit ribosomal protein L23